MIDLVESVSMMIMNNAVTQVVRFARSSRYMLIHREKTIYSDNTMLGSLTERDGYAIEKGHSEMIEIRGKSARD